MPRRRYRACLTAAGLLLAVPGTTLLAGDGPPGYLAGPAPPQSALPDTPYPTRLPPLVSKYAPALRPETVPPPVEATAGAEILPPPRNTPVLASPEGGIVPGPAGAILATPPIEPIGKVSSPGLFSYIVTGPHSARAELKGQPCKQRVQACGIGFLEEFEQPPLGYSVAMNIHEQVANRLAARMVLFHYDFADGSNQLNYRGKEHLRQITCLLPQTDFPVVIEETPEVPALAEARRLVVLTTLALGPCPVPVERVLVGPPLSNGMRGVEAVIIDANLLRQTEAAGVSLAGGAAAGGATAGASLGLPVGGGTSPGAIASPPSQ